ncbi:dipeptide ABC transporter ATP-binding protein [Paenarthrobacter nicotinovorans]|uniref:dipeptide ABC transporter ATP-binding protein n=1 Tax=Paenarthrobacter nicotinovorans TaxID=29320 RepID=UPI003D676350
MKTLKKIAPTATGLAVSDLTVISKSRRTPIVQDVSFELSPGQVLGLVGESGSGKSTVAVALLGLARRGLEISGGSVRINDQNVLALTPRELREARGSVISYVPQDPGAGLNPGHKIGWQLREALTVHRSTLPDGQSIEERIFEVLMEVGLPADKEILERYPHQLSGGQQQRVAIGMAFASRPKVIVLDEPTTGLDVTTQRRVLDTVRDLTERYQVMSVYISHDLSVVAQIADRVAVMYAGRIVEMGPASALFTTPRHPYTAGLIAAAPSASRATVLVGIEGRPPRPGLWPKGCCFADRCANVQADCKAELPALLPMAPDQEARCLHPVAVGATKAVEPPAAPQIVERGDALQVRDLLAQYGTYPVLHGVDLDLRAGQCTAVVGQSGSGKTTLARCLVGLHDRWQGSVVFGDAPIGPRPKDRTGEMRRKIQYVFQNPYASLNPRISVGQNLEEPLRHFTSLNPEARRERVNSILSEVALSPIYADRMPDQLSGGERQRVAVARALIVEPDILVCDEITSALDVSVQALLVEQLRRLQHERGLSLLFITHDLGVVRSLAQNVVVLEGGRAVESGPVETVLTEPSHPYTKKLLADLPDLRRVESFSN